MRISRMAAAGAGGGDNPFAGLLRSVRTILGRPRSRSRERVGRNGNKNLSDIIFQDKDVCILKPDSERGVPIYHISSNPNICIDKLYSYNGLRKAKPELHLKEMIHSRDPDHFNYIFFMPPYSKTGEKTFKDYHGKTPEEILGARKIYGAMAIIKVDPEETFVYFQMARSEGEADNSNIICSKMRLSDFIDHTRRGKEALEATYVSSNFKKYLKNIHFFRTNVAWEVVVKTDFLDRSSYICVENNIPFVENSVQKSRTSSAAIPAAGGSAAAGAGGSIAPSAAAGAGGGAAASAAAGGSGGAAASAAAGGSGSTPDTFNAEWVDNRFIQCPICKIKQNAEYIDRNQHVYNCPNKGKIPNIDWASRPASGGRRRFGSHSRRRSRRRLNRRRRRHTRR